MSNALILNTVDRSFFQPLTDLCAQSPHARPCPEFSDEFFVHLGVQRVMELSPTGRGFLQEHGLRFAETPGHSNYFAALSSSRRRDLLRDVNSALIDHSDPSLVDRLAAIPELANYECFAADGHWHKAAAHDARHRGAKMAVGHFYRLNLRTHTLRHLAAGEGLHEHDLHALKRVQPKGLRQGVRRGRRVLVIYDKAVIDFCFWKRCRKECAVYFLSRVKEGMAFDLMEEVEWNRTDPRNHGVSGDHRVMIHDGQILRIIYYTDPCTGKSYEFLTNDMDLPAGVLVELYRRRWEAEKVFDEIKNKLEEKKAWASSLVAKESQAQLIALTHNLMVIYEWKLERDHGVINEAEDKRRAQRSQAAAAKCAQAGTPLSDLVRAPRRTTQRSVKFVRWIRQSIRDRIAEGIAVAQLKALYATP